MASGAGDLQAGAVKLADGTKTAQAGAAAAVQGADKLAAGSATLASGSTELKSGATTLSQRTAEASQGASQLAAGAGQLQGGVTKLADGVERIGQGVGTINSRLPDQADLNTLQDGAKTLANRSGDLASGLGKLKDGAITLSDGTTSLREGSDDLAKGAEELHSKIPTNIEELDGDPEGLSQSVTSERENFAAVTNNGMGFAPYFMSLSLWVGAVMATFIFPFQQLPAMGRGTSQGARVLRKYLTPALLAVLQAVLMVITVQSLGVNYLHPFQVTVTAILASLTFLMLILALILLFGSVGRFIALVLLILQLASSGGSFPVEVSPRIFQNIHNWVPVTQAVGALRHAITGAYQGQYMRFMIYLLMMLGVSTVLALLGRRKWEIVDDADFRPLIVEPLSSHPVAPPPPEERPFFK